MIDIRGAVADCDSPFYVLNVHEEVRSLNYLS